MKKKIKMSLDQEGILKSAPEFNQNRGIADLKIIFKILKTVSEISCPTYAANSEVKRRKQKHIF